MPSSEVHQNNDQSSQKKWTSETSLQKRISNNSVALESLRAHAKASYVNSASFLNELKEGVLSETSWIARLSKSRLSLNSETERKQASDKWMKTVAARDLELKRLERERREAEIKAQREWEAHQRVSANKVAQWMRKKQIEASRKVAPPAVTVETPISKPKEFKKGIHYQDWLSKKNVELKALKKEREEMKEQKAQLKFRKTLLQPLRDFGHQVRCREKKPSKPGNKNSICWETIDDWDAAMVQEEATAAAVHQRAWELVDDWDAKAWDTISNWD